jgi:hypothetical protein
MHVLKRLLPVAFVCLGAVPALAQSARAGNIETIFASHAVASPTTVDHSIWDKLLKTYLKPAEEGLNRVDYKKFQAEAHKPLKDYVRKLEGVDVGTLDRAEQFAFWANLYNARTIDIVLDHYPVKSIKDINLGGGLFATFTGGPWKAKVVTVNGQSLSLDDIEHTIMRGIFKDHRVHFAVNCASIGCPNLGDTALTGARLDELLDKGGRDFINSPRGVKLANGKLQVSKIFSWFQADFGGSDRSVLEHVRRYAAPELKAQLEGVTRIDDTFYDWRLNDVRR